MIRAGETLAEAADTYDPLADEKALAAQQRLSRSAGSGSGDGAALMSRSQVEELRRVQNERIEAAKMKQMGLQVKASAGVRMDSRLL